MNADFNINQVTRYAAVKKIPFSEIERISLECDYEYMRNIWYDIREREVKKEFMPQFISLQIVLDGDDFIKDLRTVVITYSKIPLYN